MKVILAGFNIDQALLPPALKGTASPESIAAAYARISRSPLSTYELREIARKDVEKARESNKKIVFEMGHSSIAEHAVFNIDIIGVSRLLVEEIEKFRLVSFTEKSQRYSLFQDDFTLPAELSGTSLAELFVSTVRRQQHFYRYAYEKLKNHLTNKSEGNFTTALNNEAKEDARYVIPLATQTQLGMTVNARNLELMIRRLAAHPLEEAKAMAQALYEAVYPIAPSLIRYTKPTAYDLASYPRGAKEIPPNPKRKAVTLVWYTPDADARLIAAFLFRTNAKSYEECLKIASRLSKEKKREVVKASLRYIQTYDQVRREFEMVDLVFELTVSASCFAQLKRHRMATILTQDYHPALGVTVPPNISAAGMEEAFLELTKETNDTFELLHREKPHVAPYILTNGHRRRVLLKVNARELYHIARLRADRHAQWDIRGLAEEMLSLAKEAMPITFMLACGRDVFPKLYHATFAEEEHK